MSEREPHVPLINISQDDSTASQQLFDALTTSGFACLTNTGLWGMAQLYSDQARKFFDLPAEEKVKFARPAAGGENGGWASIGREQLSSDRPGDYKEIYNMDLKIKGNPYRASPVLDTPDCWSLWNEFEKVSNKVLYLIGLGLKLNDPYQLVKTHTFPECNKNRSALRLAWYPKVDKDALKPGQIRCGEHSDYGSITLLYSSAPGLQVMSRELGEYMDAGFIEGGIYVNIGDMLQMWSGDVLIANKHRVLIPEEQYLNQDRVSVIFFAQPDNHTVIETLDGSGKYPPVIADQWLTERFLATYDQ